LVQIVEAKVHQLNPVRGRIFLSLKEITVIIYVVIFFKMLHYSEKSK
jgi:ribosomal protein S1